MAECAGPLDYEEPPAGAADRASLHVRLAAPRGFCAGVRRAIDAVTGALDHYGAPVYVRRAIVHNLAVVRGLEAQGAVFVQEVDQVPPGAVLVLSAHGVPQTVFAQAEERGLRVIDAMCPLVAKVHREVVRHHRDGRHIFLIGHRGHAEIEGTLGQLPSGAAEVIGTADEVDDLATDPSAAVAYAVQTTFSVDEAARIARRIEARFKDVARPFGSDICYATTNRQSALKTITPTVDAVIVVGESFSSNAARLAELASAQGCRSVQLVAEAEDLDWAMLARTSSVGITAAASTPESSVAALLDALRSRFDLSVEEVGASSETASFRPVLLA